MPVAKAGTVLVKKLQYCTARTQVESVSVLAVTKVGLFISRRFEDHGSVPHYLKKKKINPLRKKNILTTLLKSCCRDRSGNTEFPGKSPQDVPCTAAAVEAVVLQTGFRRFTSMQDCIIAA